MMRIRRGITVADATILLGIMLGLAAAGQPFAALAQGFSLFNLFGAQPPAPPVATPFRERAPIHVHHRHRIPPADQAWCVRNCDGRYFPITGSDDKSRTEICSNFCPASQTTLVHGNAIDDAVTDSGKPYSGLPNAFRYRNELVAGCTCTGKDGVGLASVSIDNDPTLHKGDIVAGAKGLQVASRDADARGTVSLSPLPRSTRARFRHLPMVASDR
jgi:Protein of unknown function (DUF2865)